MTRTHQLTLDEIRERNVRVVEAHFHNENPDDIDKAIELYADEITWEVPARGVRYHDHASVRAAYLKLFQTYQVKAITPIKRLAAENWVFDDAVYEMTLVGDVQENVPGCPYPVGTEVSMRLVHLFEFDDEGKITRENGYEIWRRADGPIDDDIPADAVITRFD